jgi:hypothetical protein
MLSRSIFCFISLILFLSLPLLTIARRGGGSGSSDDDSSSDSSSGSSSSSSPDASEEREKCRQMRLAQQEYVYSHVGSYYNGSLTVTHSIQDDRDDDEFSGLCKPSNLGTKTYTFTDAVLHIGPPLDSNNSNNDAIVYWELRAFIPYENGRYSYRARWGPEPKREIVRLQSAAYDYNGVNLREVDAPTECWDTEVTRSAGAGAGYNISAQYTQMTRLRFGGLNLDIGPSSPAKPAESTSNWITLVDICTNGFDPEGQFYGDDYTIINITEWSGKDAGMVFLQPGRGGAAAPTALISGVGTNEAKFSITNGSLQRAFFGATSYLDNCFGTGAEYSPYYFYQRYISPEKEGRYSALNRFDLNLTATFELSFEGRLQEERSWGFDSGGDIPQWDFNKRPKVAPDSGNAKLEAGWAVLYTIAFWAVLAWAPAAFWSTSL